MGELTRSCKGEPLAAGRAVPAFGVWPFSSRYRNASAPTDLFGCLWGPRPEAKPEKFALPELSKVELALDLQAGSPRYWMGGLCVPVRRASGRRGERCPPLWARTARLIICQRWPESGPDAAGECRTAPPCADSRWSPPPRAAMLTCLRRRKSSWRSTWQAGSPRYWMGELTRSWRLTPLLLHLGVGQVAFGGPVQRVE